jgi:hypothetical protein
LVFSLVIGIDMRAVCKQDCQIAPDIPVAQEDKDHASAIRT